MSCGDGDIRTFAVLDLETNGLPSEQFNKCSITEISLYAFSAKCFTDRETINKNILKNVIAEGVEGFDPLPPELPRVLNKMTLMVNPRSIINPTAEQVTGLSNEMLEHESPFDENTAKCLNLFFERLEQPVCLVAHNGSSFDFPIIRHIYEKVKMSLPPSIYCVDSLKAFRELDEKSEEIESKKKIFTMHEADEEDIKKIVLLPNTEKVEVSSSNISEPLEENSKINWELNNETTPKRKNHDAILNSKANSSHVKKRAISLSVRRSLFADKFKPKIKYPPKGIYKLGQIYKRCFNQEPLNLHRAESDVEILTKLILHYGLDFVAYAEERKQLFKNVAKLGSSI